jgi:ribosomal protein S18 acetylase RimI-like enzyme
VAGTGALVPAGPGTGRLVRISGDPEYRRQGLGRAIVAQLIAVDRERDYPRFLVETNKDWTDAIGLYQACGFVVADQHDGELHFAFHLT